MSKTSSHAVLHCRRTPEQRDKFQPYKVSSDVHTGWMYGRGMTPTHDSALNGWTRKSHQLGRQIACGATVGSEANEQHCLKNSLLVLFFDVKSLIRKIPSRLLYLDFFHLSLFFRCQISYQKNFI